MIACPFCHFQNEKGSLFCEQCKSDLGKVEAAPAPPMAEVIEEPPAPMLARETVENALSPGAQPYLLVVRGLKQNVEYAIVEGMNYIGRRDEKAVDIDLEDQEPEDKVWSSRQHAVIVFEKGLLSIEDLRSSNGTFVNRSRIEPGVRIPLKVNDILHIGTVQLKVACK